MTIEIAPTPQRPKPEQQWRRQGYRSKEGYELHHEVKQLLEEAEALSAQHLRPNPAEHHHDDIPQPSARLTRKEFVSQQEGLWGKNDSIAEEDVPEGELTYEQYLAQRPVAEEGDRYHENGRVHDAITGAFAKKAAYEDDLASATSRESTAAYYATLEDKSEAAKVYDEAASQNERYDRNTASLIQNNAEGEILVKKDPRLQGLMGLGQEMLGLYTSKATEDQYQSKVKPALEAKKIIFEDLLELYRTKGIDERALGYIADETYGPVEDPDFVAIKGTALYGNEKVKIIDFTESPDKKQKAYTIEKEDGSVMTVRAGELEFKREYEKPQEVEPPKKWWQKAGTFIRERAGVAYWTAQFETYVATPIREKWSKWLEYGVTDEMSDEEKDQRRKDNRYVAITAGAGIAAIGAIVGGILIAKGYAVPGSEGSIGLDTHQPDATTIPPGTGVESAPPTDLNSQSDVLNHGLPPSGGVEIMSGEGGEALFNRLGIDSSKWYDNAQILASRFPADFAVHGQDVWITHSGSLSTEAQNFINSLR